jgi:hypothetical protein
MEGSAIAKTREITRRDTHEILRRAGLPANAAVAWTKARLRVTNASCKTAGKAQEDTGAAGGGGRHSF